MKWLKHHRHDEYRLSMSFGEIVVHHHRDEAVGQWVYSCHAVGRERIRVGACGDTHDIAQRLAVRDLKAFLRTAVADLNKVKP